ncbi:N-formylglutamate amidohydrolase [Sphingobacteruim zhuxiongii]|nr:MULTISPECIES: N-formylglutamate amidohydrolase [unclassified Sphingobacterium]
MNQMTKYFINQVESPFWAFALHDGHQLADELLPYMLLSDAERLREEDPFTAAFAELPINQFIVGTSRFQLDINRDLENAIYLAPAQAWGLKVWNKLPEARIAILQKEYASVYQEIDSLIKHTIEQHGYFFVFDIHSYNSKREGPHELIDKQANPQINLGTAYVQPKWRELVSTFMTCWQQETMDGEPIDIRENVKFKGGYLNRYLNSTYGESGCVVSIEFRKDFMDEWTGAPDPSKITANKQLLLNSLKVLTNYFDNDRKE